MQLTFQRVAVKMFPDFSDDSRGDDVFDLTLEDALAASPLLFVRFDNLGRPLMSGEDERMRFDREPIYEAKN